MRKTKTLAQLILTACFLITGLKELNSQTNPGKKLSLTVLNIDTKGLNIDAQQLGNLVRTELEKLDSFEVMDRYDVAYVIEKNKLTINNCYGKLCLTEIGEIIKSDKMFTGSVEQYGRTIVTTFRLIDIKTKTIEKTFVQEFLNFPDEIQSMMNIAVRKTFGLATDPQLTAKLTKRFEFDNAINNPNQDRLKLDGPRMGFVTYSGNNYDILTAPKSAGGFNAFPAMFQFGYQFEKQYLNEGKIQALFEFVPMITGLDQGYFIPSFSLMHGLRSNVNGWEFAFGPTFNVVPKWNGYYEDSNTWHREQASRANSANVGKTNPHAIIERLDSRGDNKLQSAFVFAFGRTFRSGKLNIPVNAYIVPGKEGWRFGASFGFNVKNKKKKNKFKNK